MIIQGAIIYGSEVNAMNAAVVQSRTIVPALKDPQLFREQCFVSMEADEATGLKWVMEKDLLRCILWGSDYPHFDSTYPGAYEAAQETFDSAGSHVAHKVVLDNPRRFMGFA